jgi:ABC-type glycerol-3-phosphate transport system permease component
MLDLTIYSYGYSEIIFHTLQAIAMFRNSAFYTTIISTVAVLAGLTYAIQMAGARADEQWRQALRRVIGMAIFIQALLLPVTTMTVKDHVEKHHWRVDNVPLAFALPIGIVENFGHILTAGFEQVFSLVDGASSHSYYHYGTVFGARLQKEVLQAKVRDPEFISNMANFIDRCVVLPAMIGKQFTKEELMASEDLWGLVSSRAGTFTRTPMTINGNKVTPHPTCKDAVPYFEKKFEDAIGTSITSWSWKFKGAGRESKYNPASRALNQNIKTQISEIYKSSSSVDSFLKHNMMINALSSSKSGAYPAAKAQLHNEAGGLISGDLAEKTLTGSLAIMKVIIYGSYIFLFPLLLLSGGIAKYRSWITAAMSLALWPALFSMLNMIIDFAYQPATVVSYSSWSTELKKFDSIASTAANLTLLIPMLSFWITRMGEGGFMHLAGAIMTTANSASSALAGEKSSGSRSWDNESIRNRNSDNVSGNKHDSSMQYVSGAARSMMPDGGMEMITPGGKAIYFGGAGQSSSTGESGYHEGSGIVANYTKGVRDETQLMNAEQSNLTKSQQKLVTQEASALYTIMDNLKSDKGYSLDTSTDEGKEISKAINEINKLGRSDEAGWKQNAEGYITGEVGPGKIGEWFGVKGGVGARITAANDSSQSDSETNDISTDEGVHDKTGNNQRTGKTENIMESLGVDKNTQDSIHETYQKTEMLEKSVSTHKDKIDSYNKAIDYTKSHSGEYSKDRFQDVVDAYQNKYGGSSRQAYEAVSSGSDKARAVFRELTANPAQEILGKITNKGNEIKSSNNVNDFEKKNQINNKIGGERDKFAKDNGIRGEEEVNNKISRQQQHLETMHDARYERNSNDYEKVKQTNTDKKTDMQDQIDEHEANRIGRGKAGTAFGLINGVGRPPEAEDNSDKVEPQNVKVLGMKNGQWEVLSEEERIPRHAFRNQQLKKGTDGQYVDPKKK